MSTLGRLRDFVFRPGYAREYEAGEKALAHRPAASTDAIIGQVMPANRSNPPRRGGSNVVVAYEDVPRLRSVVERIADAVASTKWEAWYATRSAQERGAKRIPKHLFKLKSSIDALKKQSKQDETLVELEDHLILDLLNTGNPHLDGHQCAKLSSIWYDCVGEWFQLIEMNESTGKPLHLWPIPPSWIQDTPHDGYPYFRVRAGRGYIEVPMEWMVWCKNPSPVTPYRRGSGMGYTLGDEIDTDEYAADVIKSAFQNNNLPHSILVLQGFTREAVKIEERKWQQQYGSPSKANRVRFAGGNDADIKQVKLDQSFKDMQMSETRKDQRDIISQSYGVPPELIGVIENSNRATSEAADHFMQQYIVGPRLEATRRCYQRQLVPFYDDRLILDYPDRSKDDKDRQAKIMGEAPYNFTRNQWQEIAGMDHLGEEGEVYLQPINLVAVKAGETAPDLEVVEIDEEDENGGKQHYVIYPSSKKKA